MCQEDGQNPGASGRTSSGQSKPGGTGGTSGGQSKPGADCRMSGARDGLWRTREAGG